MQYSSVCTLTNTLDSMIDIQVIVVTQALVHCLICPHSPKGAAHPQASCGHIRQCTHACVATNMSHFQHSKNLSKLAIDCSAYLHNKR